MFHNNLTCKICGGEIAPDEQGTKGSCLGCGAESMFPKCDIKKLNRITYLRNELDFEGAAALADGLAKDNASDSEAYWNRLLCRYGIQYIRSGGKRVPVCRINTKALPELTEDDDYKRALYYATEEMQAQYTAMGERIAESVNISRGAFAQTPEYDIFVLTGEEVSSDNDLDGERLFLRFTENLGFKVFYAPESLKELDDQEKAARTACALENSRVLLAVFKNSADAFSGRMKYAVKLFEKAAAADGKKQVYAVFDSHKMNFQQLPESLVWSDEAFDSSDDDFMREISEVIEKILKPEEASIVPDAIVTATAANKENLVKRAYMFLEDGEFETADTYFDKILDIDIEEARAYFGKLLAERRLTGEDKIMTHQHPLTDDKNYIKAIRFAGPELKAHYEALNNQIVKFIEEEKKRISDERQRLRAEREEKEAIERQRRMRQEKEERKKEFQKKVTPLKEQLVKTKAELNKTLIMPARRKELEEEKMILEKNIKELEFLYQDIWN